MLPQTELVILNEQNRALKSQIDLTYFSKNYLYTRLQGKNCVSSDCVCGTKCEQNKKSTHCEINKETIHCYVCEKNFDVFDLIQAKENCNFVGAKQKLASILNVEIEKPKRQKGKQLFFDKEFNDTCINNQNNNFSKYCKEKLDISEIHLKSWGVGTYGKGLTIFLQKDTKGQVWNYQAMPYNEKCKKSNDPFSAKQPEVTDKSQSPDYYASLLYGFHLLREDKNIAIIVVESPKSAVIASFFYPQYDFVACMSANGLTEYFCELLKNTNKPVYWLCDADGNEYNEKNAILYGGRLNSSITHLSKIILGSCIIDLFADYKYANNHIESKYHYDIADFIIDNIAAIKNKLVKLPDLLNSNNIYSSLYWVENIYLTAKQENKDVVFWEVDFKGQNNIIEINIKKFIDFLHSKGFGFMRISKKDKKSLKLIRIYNNIIDFEDDKTVQFFVNEYVLEKLPNIVWESNKEEKKGTKFQYLYKDDLLNELYVKATFLYSEKILRNLPTIKPNILKDTKNIAYKPFLNGVVKIEKDIQNVKMIKYENLDGCVWQNVIIQRNFEKINYPTFSKSNFFKYLELTQNSEENNVLFDRRFTNLINTLGYLLHSHKDQTETKLVIAIDEGSDNSEKGGSGKSIVFHKALKYFTDVAYQDAKSWDYNRDVKFGFIKYGEKVAVINDLVDNFPIETLYNAISDDMTIRFMHQDSLLVDFEETPKFVCTTNFTIKGDKNSDLRRQHFIEFSSWFKQNKTTIIDYFGETFFQDWSKEQWQNYDNTMIYCIQNWLNVGKLENVNVNYSEKKFRETMNENILLLLDESFKSAELGGKFQKGEKNMVSKANLLNTLYPAHERKKNINHYYALLKQNLETYFNFYAKDGIKLRYLKNMYPYYSNGNEHFIFIEE